ncbi:hypothetical protein FGU71_14000 [Erythrobacter insulae]|uniref:MACPF domain-containing protein n=1 Tax=Erythrobacter insulae TaxID=2584124 RepID=A0A547P7H1_9SPHN|nr:MAC/perforin domain-containing protein [Erythrobacter insulae]TRD10096.1 hypothetical protein FGU71_14000 [Erythrobacter insulae]
MIMSRKAFQAVRAGLLLGCASALTTGLIVPAASQQVFVGDNGIYGQNVARADYEGGSIRQISATEWGEYDTNGNLQHTYRETSRDDWAVEMWDESRKVWISVNMLYGIINRTDPGGSHGHILGTIISATANASNPKVALPAPPDGEGDWYRKRFVNSSQSSSTPPWQGGQSQQLGQAPAPSPPPWQGGQSQPMEPRQPPANGGGWANQQQPQPPQQGGNGWASQQQPQQPQQGGNGWASQQQPQQPQQGSNGWASQQQPQQPQQGGNGWASQQQTPQQPPSQQGGNGWGNQQQPQQNGGGGWAGNQPQQPQQNGGGWNNSQQPAQTTNSGGWANNTSSSGTAKPWEKTGDGFNGTNNSNTGSGFGGADAVDPFEEIVGVWVESNKPYRSEASNNGNLVAWTGPRLVRFKKVSDTSIAIQSDLFAWDLLQKTGPGKYSGRGITVSISKSGSSEYMQISGGRSGGSFEPARTADGGLSKARFSEEVQGSRDDRRGLFNQDGLTREWNNNFHSYDALNMNLFNAAAGRKVQIFKQPGSFDYAVDDNINLGLPYGLRGNRVRSSSSRQTEALITNAAEFQKTMSMSFGGGIKLPKVGFGVNYSREKTAGTSTRSSSLNAIGIARIERYALILDPPNIQLSDNFKRAIDQLANGRMTARQFRETYGSHYSKAIVYGGLGKAEKTMTSEQVASFVSEKYQAGGEGNLKGANLSGSFGESKSSSNSNESVFTRDEFEAVGGSGSMSFSGWSVSDADTVPVRYDLRPLSDLINPIFLDISTYEDLTKYLKAYNALKAEIDNYVESAPKLSNRTVGPKIYEIFVDRLYCTNKGDNDGNSAYVYGKFTLLYRGDARDSQSITLMDSSENGQKMFCGSGASGAQRIGKKALVTVTANSQYSGGGDHGWMGFVSTQASYEDEGWKDKQDPIAPLPGMGRLFPIATKANGKIQKEIYGLYPAPNLVLEYTIRELK